MRYAQTKLEQLFDGRLQSLFLSGAPGVGKTTLVEHLAGTRPRMPVSWVPPGVREPEALLAKLVHDLGPGEITGTLSELRNVLEVYLKHQLTHQRVSVIVVDAVERLALPVIRELEALCRMRLRHRPLLHCVFITRNEALIANMLGHLEQTRPVSAVHQRLSGFTLDETIAYIRAVLQGAGGEWIEELFPAEALIDVQAFTRGIVGDIDALCGEVLDTIAAQNDSLTQMRVTRALLKESAVKLHLRYDPTPWRQRSEERLMPDAVRLSDPDDARVEEARLIVTSGGRMIAEIPLERPRMVLGRDAACDISLDSSYVSRYQNLFMQTADGWMLFDLNSTNGCFVNGRRVREHPLRDGDLIAVGHHQLRFASTAAQAARTMRGEDTIVSPEPAIGKLA